MGKTLSAEDEDCHEFDLPVMSNISKVLVKHFMLDLSSDIISKTFVGSAIYFIQPVKGVKSDDACLTFPQCETARETNSTLAEVSALEQDDTKNDKSLSVSDCSEGRKQFCSKEEVIQKTETGVSDLYVDNDMFPPESSIKINQHAHGSSVIGCHEEIDIEIGGSVTLKSDICNYMEDIVTKICVSGKNSGFSIGRGDVSSLCHFSEEINPRNSDKNVTLNVAKNQEKAENNVTNISSCLLEECASVGFANTITEELISDDTCEKTFSCGKTETQKQNILQKTEDCLDIVNSPDRETCSSFNSHENSLDSKFKETVYSLPQSPENKAVSQVEQTCANEIESHTENDCKIEMERISQSADFKKDEVCSQSGEKESTFVCRESKTAQTCEVFQFILDSCDVDIIAVEEVVYPNKTVTPDKSAATWREWQSVLKHHDECPPTTAPLRFSVEKWCVKIEKPGVTRAEDFPSCIRVKYKTKPDGRSLKWSLDQDGKLSVFTHGHWINNRALFPGQDSPVAMSTWQARIHVPVSYTVLMSGDQNASCFSESNGYIRFDYCTSMTMPASTLALAIGIWSSTTLFEPCIPEGQSIRSPCIHHADSSCHVNYCSSPILPCRLFAPKSMMERAVKEIKHYIPLCMRAAHNLLGNHPFCRLDILVVPKCFASLALACPCLMFISQSLLPGDCSVNIRLAHELSHSWFGLLIGALDWTEEWLTEGFATYLEDCIHGNAMGWDENYQQEYSELRAVLRHRNLSAEMSSTEEKLQILRPSKDAVASGETEAVYIKHGMNPDKTHTQVHYLKGYFLLRHLSQLIGVKELNTFIHLFVLRFHGELICSQNVFDFLFETFPWLRDQGYSFEVFCKDWLDFPGMPKPIVKLNVSENNNLISQVQNEFSQWKPLCKKPRARRSSSKRRKTMLKQDPTPAVLQVKLIADQLVLLLELMLEEDHCPASVLRALYQTYDISSANADVGHRWCELVIKHRCVQYYQDVTHFLVSHQAMGVYLFGELIISGDHQQRELAIACFEQIRKDMEEGPYTTVHTMIYGQKAVS